MADIERLQRALRNAHNAGDTEAAQRLAGMIRTQRQQDTERFGESGSFERLAAQAGVGSQFGIANMLGLPVDAVAGALSGIGEMTGLYGPIEAPVGGSEFFSSLMAPIRQNVPDPTTRGERVARRVGEEVGAAAAGFPLAFAAPAARVAPSVSTGLREAAASGAAGLGRAARAAPAQLAAVEGAAAVGAGLGAGALQEAFPESTAANILGALGGGLTVGGAASRLGNVVGGAAPIAGAVAARTPGLSDNAAQIQSALEGAGAALPRLASTPARVIPGAQRQQDIASDVYSQVRADTRVLPREVNQSLADRLTARMTEERLKRSRHKGSAAVLDDIMAELGKPMRVEDLEDLRRMTTDNMPEGAKRHDFRMAQTMRQEITDFIDELDDPVANLLREGRVAYRSAQAASEASKLLDKAVLRAASTGTGGNTVNAIRQNLRQILDSPSKSRSFTSEELAAMRSIVTGTETQNLLRQLAKLSPSANTIARMFGLVGVAGSPAFAIPAIATTEGARFLVERSTRNDVEGLLQQIARDMPTQTRQQGAEAAIRGLLGLRTIANQ